jgi:hypothetical protein
MAAGALTVQFRDAIASFVPTTMKLGYYTPSPVINGTQRIGAGMVRSPQLGAYQGGNNRLLSLAAYQAPGRNKLTSLAAYAQSRRAR